MNKKANSFFAYRNFSLNLPFIGEFASDFAWERVDEYLAMAGLPERSTPIPAERAIARQEAAIRDREKQESEERAALDQWRAEQRAPRQQRETDQPKWGTPEAKRREIERVRMEIENRKKG